MRAAAADDTGEGIEIGGGNRSEEEEEVNKGDEEGVNKDNKEGEALRGFFWWWQW